MVNIMQSNSTCQVGVHPNPEGGSKWHQSQVHSPFPALQGADVEATPSTWCVCFNCLGYTVGRTKLRRLSWVVLPKWLGKGSLKIQKMARHHASSSVLASVGHLTSSECTEFSSACC